MQCEPSDGELCVTCWQKISDFNTYYTHIESVHESISKSRDIVLYEPLKIELDEGNIKDEQSFDNEDWPFENDDEDTIDSVGEFEMNISFSNLVILNQLCHPFHHFHLYQIQKMFYTRMAIQNSLQPKILP